MNNKSKTYSSFWDNSSDSYDVDEFLGNYVEKGKGKDIVALSGYKRAISNFVNIVTGDSIPVTFNSNDASYTDGKTVTIGSNLNDKKFDVAVGLALHEASHIKLSDFDFLRNLEYEIPAETYTLGEGKGVPINEVISLTKNILNYIEDRRIDNFIFTTSPGYKGYYHNMYDKYFYSKIVDNGLLSSEMRDEVIESYLFRIINLHNKNRQLGALSGLRKIYNRINIGNIARLTSTRDVFEITMDVVNIILNSIDNVVTENSNDENSDSENSEESSSGGTGGGDENSDEDGGAENSNGGSGSGDENSDEGDDENSNGGGTGNDDGSEPVELTDNQKRQLENAMNKQEKFLDGDIKKTKLSKKDNNSVNAVDESGASYEQVGGGVDTDHNGSPIGNGTKCLVVKKLTQSLIDSGMFSCATKVNQRNYNNGNSWNNYNFVEEGLRLGSILGKKLKIRGEETSLKYSRKDSGKIDKRMLAECGFGNSNVFSQTFIEKYNKAYLHISVDASGSMSGTKWNKAMTSAVAMIKAADMAGNIDVVVSIRTTHGEGGYGRSNSFNAPMIMVCYDSRVDKLIKVKSLFPSLNVSGTTPEGLCFEAIMNDLIPGNSNQDSYFINYSDGGPWYSNSEICYSGHSASRHTRKMVNEMRNRGLKVMSYFIGESAYEMRSSEHTFKEMYGVDASFINSTNMMEVSKTMNEKFMEV
ncbi:MAG: VWA domain-containing protein [Candidatus Pelagibacter sp.]|nr:VWA domain-containing protein [Candidatus Pelagibacter sp.]